MLLALHMAVESLQCRGYLLSAETQLEYRTLLERSAPMKHTGGRNADLHKGL